MFKNSYTFFATYANIDKIDKSDFDVSYENLEEIDKWMLSKYNKLVKNVTESFEYPTIENVISEKTSEDMKYILEQVVAGGSGKNGQVEGYRVGGKTATSEDANDVIAYIREVVANLYGELANEVRIQYGGSVKPSNVAEIMNQNNNKDNKK